MSCPLCAREGEQVVWEDTLCRVIRVDDAEHPGLCRVIWHEHVAEMSDLLDADRHHLLQVVLATESALRHLLHPAKINLASLGNLVPHLHWHVIPRYSDDPHFPLSIWSTPQTERRVYPGADPGALARAIDDALASILHAES